MSLIPLSAPGFVAIGDSRTFGHGIRAEDTWVEQLQRSRPEIVHLFDEITRQLPEGVYLTGMRQNGASVELMGIAQSSTRVSALMRRIDASEWLTDPGVIKVETTEAGPARKAEFVVNLKQVSQEERLGGEAE